MFTILLMVLGMLSFITGTLVLGLWLRKHPTKANAEKSSGILGLSVGSTFITLGALLGVIPAHIFFLKYFEEFELELPFGELYLSYKRKVPFLIPIYRII